MPLTLDQLREEFLALPPEERQQLILSLPDTDDIVPLGLHPAWAEELRRRSEEYKSGRMEGIPWEIVEKELNSLDDLP
jgi:putative addiction module component (TIGR02574 family)